MLADASDETHAADEPEGSDLSSCAVSAVETSTSYTPSAALANGAGRTARGKGYNLSVSLTHQGHISSAGFACRERVRL